MSAPGADVVAPDGGTMRDLLRVRPADGAVDLGLGRCATDAAPWFVVPADRKWYRDWAVAHLLREKFDELDLGYPPADFDVADERRRLQDG